MFSRVFIAEKPNLGREIAAGLQREKKGVHVSSRGGYIQVGDDAVTWCFGHLLEMLPPEGYDPKYHKWSREHLPIIPSKFRMEPKRKAKSKNADPSIVSQLNTIQKLARDCKLVVNAGDPDREGQLIVDEVLEYIGYHGTSQRIWLASLDEKSVSNALADLKDNLSPRFVNLRMAALARSRVDWLAGMNLSRAMTIFGRSRGLPNVLSMGRVQTPTLALVVQRDRDIENFIPKDYAEIQAEINHQAGNFVATFNVPKDMQGVDPEGRLTDLKIAAAIASASNGRPGVITEVERKKGSNPPPPPYKLSSLQKDASSLHSMGAQEVLDAAQALYEAKLTTYPRTDCEFLPMEQLAAAREILGKLAGVGELSEMVSGADASRKSKAWNTEKITAHHAIIPTGVAPGNLKPNEKKLFCLIARNYILQFWPPEIFETQKITLVLDNKTQWSANGRAVLEPGFRRHMPRPGKDLPLPAGINKNDPCGCLKAQVLQKKTEPPNRFTEGSLIEAMENVHKYVTAPAAKAKLKETAGIGTEATRAGVLETLKRRGYLELLDKKKLTLKSTEVGRAVNDLSPNDIKDIALTARLEELLGEIAEGKRDSGVVVGLYCNMMAPMINAIFNASGDVIKIKTYPCPECAGVLALRLSKKHKKFWACANYPDCRYAVDDDNGKPGKSRPRPVVEVSDEHMCPHCGKPLATREGKLGKFWSCTGYPDCRFIVNDEDGKPGKPRSAGKVSDKHKCPKCEKQLLLRDGRKGKFWSCGGYPDCRYAVDDDNGKPGKPRQTGEVSDKHKCPKCGKALASREGKYGRWWGCTGFFEGCDFKADDAGGEPKILVHVRQRTET